MLIHVQVHVTMHAYTTHMVQIIIVFSDEAKVVYDPPTIYAHTLCKYSHILYVFSEYWHLFCLHTEEGREGQYPPKIL